MRVSCSRQLPRLEPLLAVTGDAVRGSAGTTRDDLSQLRTHVVQAYTVVGGHSGGKATGDELVVSRPPTLLAVVVGAGTAGEEAEAAHAFELRPERVGDTGLEPADHSGA